MRDQLPMFPTPMEAFGPSGSRRPQHTSAAFTQVSQIPRPPPPRLRGQGEAADYERAASPATVRQQPHQQQPHQQQQYEQPPQQQNQYYSRAQAPQQQPQPRYASRDPGQRSASGGSQKSAYGQAPSSQYQPRAAHPREHYSNTPPPAAEAMYSRPYAPGTPESRSMPHAVLRDVYAKPSAPIAQDARRSAPDIIPAAASPYDQQMYERVPAQRMRPQTTQPPSAVRRRPAGADPLVEMERRRASGEENGAVLPEKPPRESEVDLRGLFDEVDRKKNGYLTERELSKALVNGDYTLFDAHTVRLMMKMFDRDGDGAIYFAEFGQLWKYLHEWRQVFDRFDTSHSDTVDLEEFSRALAAFGYSLSADTVRFMFKAGSRLNRQGEREMSFDMFVQSCISIKSITDTFKRYDQDRDGFITMGFEDFLKETTKLH